MKNFIEVTREEFRAFLAAQTSRLTHSCTGICEPPFHGYYDFGKATSPVGTMQAADEALQAWCTYADDYGGKDEFHVRREGV